MITKLITGYKITSSKRIKCSNCNETIEGKEGFFNVKRIGGYVDVDIRICWNCFEKMINETMEIRKNREEIYKRLLKENMLRHLK